MEAKVAMVFFSWLSAWFNNFPKTWDQNQKSEEKRREEKRREEKGREEEEKEKRRGDKRKKKEGSENKRR